MDTNLVYREWIDECAKFPTALKRGDRVRIKEGYDIAGKVYYYIGKDVQTEASVYIAETETQAKSGTMRKYRFLAAAIEPYPYSREERIERAIEDYAYTLNACDNYVTDDDRALLFAILDAGV